MDTYIGNGISPTRSSPSSDGPFGLRAVSLCEPHGIAFSRTGTAYFTDACGTVWQVSADGGSISVTERQGDTPLVSGGYLIPTDVAVDESGNLYFVDTSHHQIFKRDIAGMITLYAGTGGAGFSGDNGPPTSAQLNQPSHITLDPSGNLYISDYGNSRIRMINREGTLITTVAGNGSSGGALGDGGSPTEASIGFPRGMAFAPDGTFYFASSVDRVWMVDPSRSRITIIAGNGSVGPQSDWPGARGPFDDRLPTTVPIGEVQDVALDHEGNLVILSDGFGSGGLIFKMPLSGSVIYTWVGDGTPGYAGDGGPAIARFYYPLAIDVDPSGNILISDSSNLRVRKITCSMLDGSPIPPPPPSSSSPPPPSSKSPSSSPAVSSVPPKKSSPAPAPKPAPAPATPRSRFGR